MIGSGDAFCDKEKQQNIYSLDDESNFPLSLHSLFTKQCSSLLLSKCIIVWQH